MPTTNEKKAMKIEKLFAHNRTTLENTSKRLFEDLESCSTKQKMLQVGKTTYKVIAFDIEVIKTHGGILLFGFYVPHHELFFAVKTTKADSPEYIVDVTNFLNKLLKFVCWKGKSNAEFEFLLIGHNVVKYDFPTTFTFIKTGSFEKVVESTEDLFDSKVLFSDNHPDRREGLTAMYKYLSNCAVIDTLLAQGRDDGNRYKSLFSFKIRLYLQKKVAVQPLEYQFESSSYSDQKLLDYNLNDLIYTHGVFDHAGGLQLLNTRTLLYEKFDISLPFQRSLSKSGSSVNTQHFADVADLKKPYKPKEKRVYLQELILLHDYHYKNEVYATLEGSKEHINGKKFLQSLGPGSKDLRTIDYGKRKLKYGQGGLHSVRDVALAKDKLPYIGKENMCAKSDENFLIVALDFQSFYVNIVAALFEKTDPENIVGKTMVDFNKQRLMFKKAKDPRDIVFKIANLAYTGSLNTIHSPVYDPLMYISMTMNGQLLCLELLHFLKDVILEVIDTNTDGVVVFLKTENFNEMNELCDQFEQKYNLKIDTRDIIDYGIFRGSNKKIYKAKGENDFVVKGADTDPGFGFTTHVVCNWLKSLEQDNFSSPEALYSSFFEAFAQLYVNKELSTKEVLGLIGLEKIKDFGYALCYYSKNPTSHCGVYGRASYCFKGNPAKCLFFTPDEPSYRNSEQLVSSIGEDVELSACWNKFVAEVLTGNYFKFLNSYHVTQNDKYVWFHEHRIPSTVKSQQLIAQNNIFFQQIVLFEQKYNLHLFPKDTQKKSFANPRLKANHQDIFDIENEKNQISYANFLLKNYPYALYHAAALCLKLERAYDQIKIICLDVDNPAVLFRDNKNIVPFLKLFLRCKKEGFFCFSSPTDTPFDRFKVLIRLENVPENLTYTQLKKLKKEKQLDFFDLEDFASVFGQNLKALEIIQFHKKILTYTYKDVFETPYKPAVKQDQSLNQEQEDLLVELFDERSALQRFYYQNTPMTKKNYFKLDLLCNRDSFVKVFNKTVQKQNIHSLTQENCLSFYQFENLDSVDFKQFEGLQVSALKEEEKKVMKRVVSKRALDEKFEFDLDKESIQLLQQRGLESNNISLEDDKTLLFYEMIFKRINKIYNTSFVYTAPDVDSHGNMNFLFHSSCPFHDEENPKAVTIYINNYGFANVHCYHQSCMAAHVHLAQINEINENIFTLHTHFIEDLFEEVNDKLEDIIKLE